MKVDGKLYNWKHLIIRRLYANWSYLKQTTTYQFPDRRKLVRSLGILTRTSNVYIFTLIYITDVHDEPKFNGALGDEGKVHVNTQFKLLRFKVVVFFLFVVYFDEEHVHQGAQDSAETRTEHRDPEKHPEPAKEEERAIEIERYYPSNWIYCDVLCSV